jgi:hypothetical protein
MGNFISQDTHGNNMIGGSTYTNNFDDLQKKIEKIVKKSKTNTVSDTINFSKQSESDIDFDSIRDLTQNGGGHDFVRVIPRRNRYHNLTSNKNVLRGGNSANKNELSSISEEDYKLLQEVLKRHNNSLQKGGCGCAGNDNLISETSPQPVNYDVLKGGAHEKDDVDKDKKHKTDKKKKHDDEISDADEDEDDYDSEDEEDLSEDTEELDDEDDDYDESSDGDELARTKGSSTSSSSSSHKKNMNRGKKHKKHQKRHSSDSDSEYVKTSQTAGSSEEIVIDSKYLYSDNNTFYGSDENSEYFKALKNRSIMH